MNSEFIFKVGSHFLLMKHLNGVYNNCFSLPGYFSKNGISLEDNIAYLMKKIFSNQNFEFSANKISFFEIYGNPERHLQYHLISSVFTIDSYELKSFDSKIESEKSKSKLSLLDYVNVENFSKTLKFEDEIDLDCEFVFLNSCDLNKYDLVLNSREAIEKYNDYFI